MGRTLISPSGLARPSVRGSKVHRPVQSKNPRDRPFTQRLQHPEYLATAQLPDAHTAVLRAWVQPPHPPFVSPPVVHFPTTVCVRPPLGSSNT